MRIIIAILLIILVICGVIIHKIDHKNRLAPNIQNQAKQILEKNNFKNVKVKIDYLDAKLSGFTNNIEKRKHAADLIDNMLAVRVLQKNNKIKIPGFITFSQENKFVNIDGLTKPDQKSKILDLLKNSKYKINNESLKEFKHVHDDSYKQIFTEDFKNVINSYFNSPGEKSLSIEKNTITLAGQSLFNNLSNWKIKLKQIFGKKWNIVDNLVIYPSVFHFPSYKIVSKIDDKEYHAIKEILLNSVIYFDLNSSEIKPEELAKIDAVAMKILDSSKKISYVIGGHTDSTGNYDYNIKLGKNRAQNVLTLLKARGVKQDHFELVSFGASRTVGNNLSEKSRSLSRRVEILIK